MSGSVWQEAQVKSPFENYNYVATRKYNRSTPFNHLTEPKYKLYDNSHETSLCLMCGQRMSRFYREDKINGNWVRKTGFFQACFNPDCCCQETGVLEEHKYYRFKL